MSEQNKALEAETSNKIENPRFNNNSEALTFGSFGQAKEQRIQCNFLKKVDPNIFLFDTKP